MRKSVVRLIPLAIFAAALPSASAAPPMPHFVKAGLVPHITAPPRDLVIYQLSMTTKPNLQGAVAISTVDVTVTDMCKATTTVAPFVLVSFFTSQGGAPVGSLVGNTVVMTNGQPGHLSLDVSKYNIPSTSFVKAQVDPYNKTYEVNKTNNTSTLNPNVFPFPPPASECVSHTAPVPAQ